MLIIRSILFVSLTFILLFFSHNEKELKADIGIFFDENSARTKQTVHVFEDTVKIKDYFKVLDGIVEKYDSIFSHPISEHLIIRNNPWVIDSLAATDYYHLKELGIINMNPKELPIFKPGYQLIIPDSAAVDSLEYLFKNTYLDLNIPEFKLRVVQSDSIIFEFPVRVGRNEQKYLAMAEGIVDLRTRTGFGTIVEHSKEPIFINPSNNHRYFVTQRDDGIVTGLPNIPWLVTEINGMRYGQLIHPTTNIETLGKAYSNGCIGTSESAAWRIYYHAPIGTRITIRYNLEILDENGDTLRLQDIYGQENLRIESKD
jgi:L,D-transpeptidase ErfK/SrfK